MNKNLLTFFLPIIIFSVSSVTAQTNKINVTDFTVSAKQQKVIIDWKTDGAMVNYFAIQKSADGINYKTIALVLGPDPKQKNCDCYGSYDKNVSKTSKQYYRLVHIAADGTEQFTEAKLLANP
jgi:hypothetical protein